MTTNPSDDSALLQPPRPAAKLSTQLVRAALAAGLVAVAAAACDSNPTCNTGTLLGTYTVSYAPADGGDTCVVTTLPDGGPTSLALVSTPATNTVPLCAQSADGGVTLFFGTAQLTNDGGIGYTTSGAQNGVAGSLCVCSIDIGSVFKLELPSVDGGPVASVDGGFTPIGNFTGRADYAITPTGGATTGCNCNVPCGAHYTLTGSK